LFRPCPPHPRQFPFSSFILHPSSFILFPQSSICNRQSAIP
jgi:hypothetical protein